jgi:predicted RNase H-like nuclease (RuvC/YqgF family)
LLKLEDLWKKFPHSPFFGDLGRTLDDVISMIRQYRRAAGEHSDDEIERKLARLHELEDKSRRLEITNEALRSEIEELRAKPRTGGEMSLSELNAAIKPWEDTVETQRKIIAERDTEIASLRARIAGSSEAKP